MEFPLNTYKCNIGSEFRVSVNTNSPHQAAWHAASMWMMNDYHGLEVVDTLTGEVFKFKRGTMGPELVP